MESIYTKHNLIFHNKIDNFLGQMFLHPILWVLGTILLSTIRNYFFLETSTFLLLLFIYWKIINRFPLLYHLYIVVGYDLKADQTGISAGYMQSRVSGKFENIYEYEDSYMILAKKKTGLHSFFIPKHYLPYNVMELLKITLSDMSLVNLEKLKECFSNLGYKIQIKENETVGYFNLYVKKPLDFVYFRMLLNLATLLFCYYLGFYLLK